MKSDIFNLNRFGKYLLSDLRNCWAGSGLSILLISIMGLIIYIGTIVMGLIFNGSWEGPELGFRIFVFLISMFVLYTNVPVKCYGNITDKKSGIAWLMIPASSFEKFLSMITITAFIAPLICGGIYLLIDLLTCTIDPTCGKSILGSVTSLLSEMSSSIIDIETDSPYPALGESIRQLCNPYLYIDDLISVSLIFLLGAIFFKTGKTAKTILAFFAFSIVLSIICTPLFKGIFPDTIQMSNNLSLILESRIFKNIALLDTISDSIVNIVLLSGIYIRIKTLEY